MLYGISLFLFSSCRQLGLDLVPRKEYAMVDPEEISITELYRLVREHNSPWTVKLHAEVFMATFLYLIKSCCFFSNTVEFDNTITFAMRKDFFLIVISSVPLYDMLWFDTKFECTHVHTTCYLLKVLYSNISLKLCVLTWI